MNKPLTIKSLLALSLAMLISLFSLQSFADEADQPKATDVEQVDIGEDAMIPDEEQLEEESGQETEAESKDKEGEPLSQSDEVKPESDDNEDKGKPDDSQLMFG